MKERIFLLSFLCLISIANSQLLCSNYQNAVGNRDTVSCDCAPTFFWDGMNCQLNCSNKVYPESKGYAKNLTACMCKTLYTWVNSNCTPRSAIPFDCSAVPNTNGSNTTNSCFCVSGYYWDDVKCVSTNSTALPGINCSAKLYAAGRSSRFTCSCIKGFRWDGYKCQLDCSKVPFSTGDNTRLLVCRCLTGYSWRNGSCTNAN